MITGWNARLKSLSVKWKIFLLSVFIFGLSLVTSFAYFTYQSYWLNVATALGGLMNFTDAKQHGVIRFIDQNEKLALQLANLAEHADAEILRSQFQSVVATDVHRLEEHPFKEEIISEKRKIATWSVYSTIDYVVNDVIRVSSDLKREGLPWNKNINLDPGYSDPYFDGDVPVMTFAGQTKEGTVFVNADARMLTNIVNGEIGNLAGDMGAFYLAGVGKTFDYYIVNKDNLMITESRSRPGQFLKGRGSEHPWRVTLQQAGVVCNKDGTYTTDARSTTGCREAMGFYVGVTGKKMLGTSMPFYDSNWTLVVEQEADELLLPMWTIFAQDIGILFLIGGLSVYLYLRLQDVALIRPLSRLQEAVEHMEKTQDFDKPIKIESQDEFGVLGEAFNRMSQNLGSVYQNLEQRVASRTEELEALNKKIQESLAVSENDKRKIQSLAFYDTLTHLPNRRLLQDRLTRALATSERSGRSGALLFVDLDNFKTLNDTLGHDVGDMLLKQAAERLESCLRVGDTVARLGGDEFVVILEALSSEAVSAAAQTEAVGEKMLDAFNQLFFIDEYECRSSASIGVVLFTGLQLSTEELLKRADIAMYQAKKAGRNTICFFDPKMQELINERASLEIELRKALEDQDFQLYYQVQVDEENRPLGAEALIRWIHPERGMISPADFVQLAEETGLILPMGQWVVDTACAQIKEWQKSSLTRGLVLAVNVSAKQFHQNDFVTKVYAAIQEHGIPPELLKLELTEGLLLDKSDNPITAMHALNNIGVLLSLDDFGTGYSSLQYLKRLPLDQLKIDQSFVRDITTDSNDETIIRTIIAMAQNLNLDVIAEGVESEEQRQFLLKNGCPHFQGYLFSRPMPIEQFEAMLAQDFNVQ